MVATCKLCKCGWLGPSTPRTERGLLRGPRVGEYGVRVAACRCGGDGVATKLQNMCGPAPMTLKE